MYEKLQCRPDADGVDGEWLPNVDGEHDVVGRPRAAPVRVLADLLFVPLLASRESFSVFAYLKINYVVNLSYLSLSTQ